MNGESTNCRETGMALTFRNGHASLGLLPYLGLQTDPVYLDRLSCQWVERHQYGFRQRQQSRPAKGHRN